MKVAPGGIVIAGMFAAIAVIAAFITLWVVVAVGLLLSVFVLLFYRDPHRTPEGEGIVAPADGRVNEITSQDGHVEIAIFLNIHNVHVVRAPADGEVITRKRVDGHRHPSFLASAVENAGVEVTTDTWRTTLRAGLIARRVRPYVEVGDQITRGERIGHIAFGSRVDIRLPPEIDIDALEIEVGDRVRAGETVLVAP